MDQLRSMRVFSRVVQEGSFAKAAAALDLAPAVVTRAIAELETFLGARLLNRTTRRLALTNVGSAYLLQVRNIIQSVDEANAGAGIATTQPRGVLRVHCPPAFAIHQLAPQLPRFRKLYPQIALSIESPGPIKSAYDMADVSILSVVQGTLQGDFVARLLTRSSFIACAAPSYLNRRGRPTLPEDILQHDGILPAVASLRHELRLQKWAKGGNATPHESVSLILPRLALTTTQIDLIYAATLAGLGIGGLPSFIVSDALLDNRLERVLPDWRGTSLEIYAAVPSRKHLTARSRVFIDFLVQTFGGKETDRWLDVDLGN
jgi:DNA-binding transcriptional LysR family regulator